MSIRAQRLRKWCSLQAWDLPELVERTRRAVVDHAAIMMLERPDEAVDHINLYLPCTFFMLRSIRCSPRSCAEPRLPCPAA